ncbi:MAG: hypothetical protein AAF368_09195 [Planctomycetota bacterium]
MTAYSSKQLGSTASWSRSSRLIALSLAVGLGSVAIVRSLAGDAEGPTTREVREERSEPAAPSPLERRAQELRNFVGNRMVVQAMSDFAQAFSTLEAELAPERERYERELREHDFESSAQLTAGPIEEESPAARALPHSAAGRLLQAMFIAQNPFGANDRETFEVSYADSAYSAAHEKYHVVLRAYRRARGLADVYLFNREGHLVYSVRKQREFGVIVDHPLLRGSDAARAFRAALEEAPSVEAAQLSQADSSSSSSSACLGAPIFDGDSLVGVAVFRLGAEQAMELEPDRLPR